MEIFQYDFIIRGFVAGILIAVIAPLIGIFLVLKRYSLIADALAHVSLLGISLGIIWGLNPILTAIGTSVLASLGIEKLRKSRRIYGESALALFLSGSLALAVVILSFYRGLDSSLFSYLFGSIVTVKTLDIYIILFLALFTVLSVVIFYRELIYISFDEDLAKTSGVSIKLINILLMTIASLVIAVSIPIIGVLLISALIVIPVVTALQLKKSFRDTLIYSEFFSISAVFMGMWLSYYFDVSTGGMIVLIMLFNFSWVLFLGSGLSPKFRLTKK